MLEQADAAPGGPDGAREEGGHAQDARRERVAGRERVGREGAPAQEGEGAEDEGEEAGDGGEGADEVGDVGAGAGWVVRVEEGAGEIGVGWMSRRGDGGDPGEGWGECGGFREEDRRGEFSVRRRIS